MAADEDEKREREKSFLCLRKEIIFFLFPFRLLTETREKTQRYLSFRPLITSNIRHQEEEGTCSET